MILHDLRINPRYDLQSSYVLIRYEQTNTVAGQTWLAVNNDQYPAVLPTAPLKHFNALRFTVDLQGLQANNTTANLVCDPILALAPDTIAQTNWWLARHPQYQPYDPTAANADQNNPITDFELIPGTIEIAPTLAGQTLQGFPNELTEGQLADWMGFSAQRITISAKANITHRNGNVIKDHSVTYQCIATNAATGSYSKQNVSVFAEPVPAGLAELLYNAVSVLQYEGELTLQEEDVSASLSVGNLFNLTGGNLAEWAAMNAMVQALTENLDTGQTTVEFRPPKHLGAGELVDLLRINRSRNTFYWPTLQTSGVAGGQSDIGLGNHLPEKNSSSTPGFNRTLVVSGQVDGGAGAAGTGSTIFSQALNFGVEASPATLAFTQWLSGGAAACSYRPLTTTPLNPSPQTPPGSITISTDHLAGSDIANGAFVKLQKVQVCQNGVSGTMYFLCSQFIPDP